jgi:light-regulated signal transduction histidine kinase (bacteriophytochrome)
MVGITINITEQKLFAVELSEQVKQSTRELQRSNEDLLQFAHVTSHDLKEPVRKIKLYTNRLAQEYGGLLPDTGKLFVEKVQHATDRILSMIEGVLAYSTVASTAQPIDTVDLNKIISDIETDLEVLIHQKKAAIKKGELPQIEGSGTLIYQLFYNLINNSLKFAKAGRPAMISVSAQLAEEAGGTFAHVTVSDNGIGFEQEFVLQIFNTFTRLNPKDRFEGTGLGLALCKKIAERHGGSIAATGERDKGASFTVLLPTRQTQQSI